MRIAIYIYTSIFLLCMGGNIYAAAPLGGYIPGATNNPDCIPGDVNCFVKTLVDTDDQTLSLSGFILKIQDGNSVTLPVSGLNSWTLGGNSGGGQAVGSTDSVLPFMSFGVSKMQLSDSNLSLSNNTSFIDNLGRNGLFIGNKNTYGNSDNTIALGDIISIGDGNKNTFIFGDIIDAIEDNSNSFIGGETISGVNRNTNILSFGNKNAPVKNADSVFFGQRNNWTNETNKFIIGNDDRKKFQVDMDTGEILFSDSAGNIGQYLKSQGSGTYPIWEDFPSFTGLNSLNTLTTNIQTFATGMSGTGFSISSVGSVHTFHIPDASPSARGMMNTGTQTFTGSKTFSQAPSFSNFTLGSIPFIGTSGLLTQNNARLFWNDSTSQLLAFSGGTGSVPTYSFFGDTDTGMYHPGNNILGFSAGGNVVARMTNIGWALGDGSLTPVSQVHIGGGTSPTTFRMTNSSSANTVSDGFFINYSTGSIVSLSNLENADMTFGTNNTERMRILANGNIAISQTGATEKLEVNGGIKISNSATICALGSAGVIRYDTTTNKHQGCNGTSWNDLY